MSLNLLPLTLTLPGLLFVIFMVPCYGSSSTDEATYNYLKGLEIEDLLKVEVSLDDVFDVFDGLVKAKKVSIATGNKQAVERAPAVTTVITAQDIEAIGARDLNEALATVPGLHIKWSGTYNPIYAIRGLLSVNNPEILMLVNGVPITATYLTERGLVWGSMPINMISRIEVIRGPGSAVYGADAYSGVINIITKTWDEIKGTEMGLRAGTFKSYEGWLLHGRQWNGFDIAASLEYRTSDGPKSTIQEDSQTQYDKSFGTHASLAPGRVNLEIDDLDTRLDMKKDFWQARVGYQRRNHLGVGTGPGQSIDPDGNINVSRTNADLTYHNPRLTPYWDITTQLSYNGNAHDNYYVMYPPGAFKGAYPNGYIGVTGLADYTLRVDTFAFYAGFQKHLIRMGTGYSEYNQYKITSYANFGINPATGKPLPPGAPLIDLTDTPYAFFKEVKRDSWYLSLQDVWTIADDWELTTGVRYDDYSDIGRTINPRLALLWQPRVNFTTKLLYGRAFRAPSFAEMYSTNNPAQQGNPNLKPEIINTWELASDYQDNQNLHLAMNLFHYKATDKIKVVIPRYQNVGLLEGNGLELEARWKLSTWFSLLAHYSYTKAMDKTANHDVGDYPRHSAYLRTDWLLIPNWYLDMQTQWVADRQRVPGDSRPPVADYTTVDLTLRYKDIRKGHTNIAFGIRNLFNAEVREPSPGPDSKGIVAVPYDLPLAGRNLFVELRYRF
jgi:iron complex outermembrane receptor protein